MQSSTLFQGLVPILLLAGCGTAPDLAAGTSNPFHVPASTNAKAALGVDNWAIHTSPEALTVSGRRDDGTHAIAFTAAAKEVDGKTRYLTLETQVPGTAKQSLRLRFSKQGAGVAEGGLGTGQQSQAVAIIAADLAEIPAQNGTGGEPQIQSDKSLMALTKGPDSVPIVGGGRGELVEGGGDTIVESGGSIVGTGDSLFGLGEPLLDTSGANCGAPALDSASACARAASACSTAPGEERPSEACIDSGMSCVASVVNLSASGCGLAQGNKALLNSGEEAAQASSFAPSPPTQGAASMPAPVLVAALPNVPNGSWTEGSGIGNWWMNTHFPDYKIQVGTHVPEAARINRALSNAYDAYRQQAERHINNYWAGYGATAGAAVTSAGTGNRPGAGAGVLAVLGNRGVFNNNRSDTVRDYARTIRQIFDDNRLQAPTNANFPDKIQEFLK